MSSSSAAPSGDAVASGGDPPPPPPEMRIWLGGLAASVTAADIEKTFSSMGRVASVEFVRTKGRNLAFFDFHPTSEKSLAKLFSAYNGCTWKGGKLRIEKAKEHYLTRLKREWEEDAKLMTTTPVNPIAEKEASHVKKIEFSDEKNMQINIFFPKLKKAKALPFKGTGKHKYSFQRIEVPSLPIHFCDCEEHNDPLEETNQKHLHPLNKVIHDKEVRIMNSVLSKLFEKEDGGTAGGEKSATDASVSDTVDDIMSEEVDDIMSEEAEEDQETDEDNLVTNIWTPGSDDILMNLKVKPLSGDQDPEYQLLQSLKNESAPKKEKSRVKKKGGPNGSSEFTSSMVAETIRNRKSPEIVHGRTSHEIPSQEPDYPKEVEPVQVQTEQMMNTVRSRNGNSWLQKSSWKDLVGKNTKSSFNIANVLPGTKSMAPEVAIAGDLAIAKKVQANGEESESAPIIRNAHLLKAVKPQKKEKLKKGGLNGPPEVAPSIESEKGGNDENLEIVHGGISEGFHSQEPDNPKEELPVEQETEPNMNTVQSRNAEKDANDLKAEDNEFCSQEPDNPKDALPAQVPTEPNSNVDQSTKGKSWLQKSSWKDLVGESTVSSFSISNVLPGIGSTASTVAKSSHSVFTVPNAAKKRKAEVDEEKSKSAETTLNAHMDETIESGHVAKREKREVNQADPVIAGRCQAQKKSNIELKKTVLRVGSSEVCTFMRSDESEKEWAKTKAALSGYINKRSTEKNSSKSSRGMPSKKGAT